MLQSMRSMGGFYKNMGGNMRNMGNMQSMVGVGSLWKGKILKSFETTASLV